MEPETPVEPVVEPTVEPVVEEKKEPTIKPMDPNRPLTGQVDKLLSKLGEPDVVEPEPEVEPAPAEAEVKEPAVKEETVLPEPQEPDDPPVDLPPRDQYILDNLPSFQTLGHTADGKDKIFVIKTGNELPDDFEFASKAYERNFITSLASQELRAQTLDQQYKQQEQSTQYQEFQTQEAIEVQADITALQREGVLPQFQYEPDDPKFNDDPAVKEANEIYDLFEKTNKAYIDAKRTYRISYRDAADKYYAAQARLAPKPVVPKVPTEREKVAAKVGAPSGTTPPTRKGPLPPGTRMDQIYQLAKQGRI